MNWKNSPSTAAAVSTNFESMESFEQPGKPSSRWPEYLCLAVYAAALALMIPFHEPWADEAQAWMLARSLSPWQLLHIYLRYEGQPGLWHLFLWALIRLHVSYTAMHWICGVLGCCATALLLFRSPFPRWLKLTLPFTLFLAYQYTVVARNYVLVPLLLFAVAAVWKRNPLLVAILLGLLANVSGHAAAIAAGFAIAWLLDRRQGAVRYQPAAPSAPAWKGSAAIFISLCCVAVLTAFPARDVYTAATPGARSHAVMALGALVWSLWDPMPLSLVGWGVLVWGFARRRALHLLIPAGALLVFSAAIYLSFWHAGLMVPVLITALWISWPRGAPRALAEKSMRVALAVLVATQIGWTVHAGWYDHFHDYSPDLRTAQYLRPYVQAGDQIAVATVRNRVVGSFHLVGIQPYFPGKIFINQPLPFWWWSRHDTTAADFPHALSLHPQIVLAEAEDYEATSASAAGNLSDPEVAKRVDWIERQGYRLDQTFCAIKPERFSYRESLCYLVFQRPGS